MDIIKSGFTSFAYTVKLNKSLHSAPTETEYIPWFDKLKKLGIELAYKISEKDKRGHLHYHGILYLPKGFFRRRVMMKNFHIKLEELYDKKGWMKYIHKDVRPEDLAMMEDEEFIQEYINPSYKKKKHRKAKLF